MSLSARKFNIVVFGATGFTGKHVVMEIVKTLETSSEKDKFTWAVAGRSKAKLDAILAEISKEIGKDVKNANKIIADVANQDSLREMARQCDVVLNCVGPYMLWGEVVVQACIEEGAHHLDLSGEAQFLEKMQLKYNKDAEESGAYIIGATGFDSIPADYGAIYLEQNFNGTLNSVESYVQFHKGEKTGKINYGTYHSALLMTHHIYDLVALKKKLYPEPYFNFSYGISWKPMQYCEDVKGWCLVLPYPDARVMERTQRYKYYQEKRQPAQTNAYMRMPNLITALLASFVLLMFGLFVQFGFIFRLLEKYPKFFTLGFITPDGPTKEEMSQKFTFTLVGKGWNKEDLKEGEKPGPPNKKMLLRVRGTNPGYGATVTMMLQAGLSIIKERERMPSKGGVYTPGIAFARTSLADRLNRNGVTFTLEK